MNEVKSKFLQSISLQLLAVLLIQINVLLNLRYSTLYICTQSRSQYYKFVSQMKKIIVGLSLSAASLAATDLEKCSRQKCPKQYQACDGDRKCLPAIRDCIKRCEQDLGCWFECLPGKNSNTANNLALCGQKNKCVDNKAPPIADVSKCAIQNCPTQAVRCSQDPECLPTLLNTMGACGVDEDCYLKKLLKKLNKEAIRFAMCIQPYNCLQTNESKSSSTLDTGFLQQVQQCVSAKCQDQWKLCTSQTGCFPALLSCINKCKDDQKCHAQCLGEKKNAASFAVAICAVTKECVKTTGAEEPMLKVAKCTGEKCPKQYKQCFKDQNCILSLYDCGTQCKQDVLCWVKCLPGKKNSVAISTALCGHQCL